MSAPTRFPIPVVLDTNVLLDWQVFWDKRLLALWHALDTGLLLPHASPSTLAEWQAVLQRPLGSCWDNRREHVLSDFDQIASRFRVLPIVDSNRWGPRCTDRSDQKFLDLALQCGAHWLFTRDKALLRLDARCRALSLTVVAPQAWVSLPAQVLPPPATAETVAV